MSNFVSILALNTDFIFTQFYEKRKNHNDIKVTQFSADNSCGMICFDEK